MQSLRNLVSQRDLRHRTRTTEVHFAAYNKRTSADGRASVGLHGERLHQIVVFELREDGSTEYSTMTLRALYNYVVRTITEACREANQERHPDKRRHRHTNFHGQNVSSREIFAGSDHRSGNDDVVTGISVIDEEEVEEGASHNGSPNDADRSPSSPYPPTTPITVPPHLPSLSSSTTTIHTTPPSIGNGSTLPTPVLSNQSTVTNSTEQSHPQQNVAQTTLTPLPNDGGGVPPHLPSLASSANATPPSMGISTMPTPILSNQGSDNNSPHDNDQMHRQTIEHMHMHRQPRQHTYPQHHPQQRAAQTAFTPLPSNGHRERLGGYLHPRDMRRLVTPFSSSNEPQLMVRRHVMLLNFDPLRAIVLRDRLLVLVPDGADSILIELEKRVMGGIAEMENQVFGTSVHDGAAESAPPKGNIKKRRSYEQLAKLNNPQEKDATKQPDVSNPESSNHSSSAATMGTTEHSSNDEWEDIVKMDWKHLPYELQSVDAVLQTVTSMLMDDARRVYNRSARAMSELRGDSPAKGSGGGGLGEHAQERLRMHKDEVNLMEGRVQGFVRAMNDVLDDDEDMTLMNLSRLLTHPERFLQPVSKEILHEESDEPELILEAYLQQALSIVNELDLLKNQIMTTEEQISMTLDAIRNRLLYINTLLSVASLCVAVGSFVGSIFGMNLTNHIETEESAFVRVTVGVIVGMVCMWAILSWAFYRAANIQSDFGKKTV